MVLSFVLFQCTKESNSNELTSERIVLRNDDCVASAGPNEVLKHEYIVVYLPGWPDCPLYGEFLYLQDGSSFVFTDFILTIPQITECEGITGSGGFGQITEYIKISNYVEAEGKRQILQNYADKSSLTSISNVKTFKSICTELCHWLDLGCLAVHHHDDIKRSGDDLDFRSRTDDDCWRTTWLRCGGGCCITTENYSLVYGKLRITSANTEQYGTCESDPPTNNWPIIDDKCINGNIISECESRCPAN